MKSNCRMGCSLVILVCLFSLTAVGRLSAEEWTVEDVILAEMAGSCRISPDGGRAVWVKTQMDKEKGTMISNLWLSGLKGDEDIQLTRGKATHSNPRWSPDGKLITFLSTRPLPEGVAEKTGSKPAETQLWAMNSDGGEPWPLTVLERAIRSYDWKDKERIIFAVEEDPTQYERDLKAKKDTSRVVEDEQHTPPVRLFQLGLKDKKIERLTHNTDWIEAFSVSPDGRWVVTRHQRSLRFQYDNEILPVTMLTNLETMEQKQVFDNTRIIPAVVEWARDGKGFFAMAPYTTHPRYFMATINLLYYYDLESGHHQKVDLDWDAGIGLAGFMGFGLRSLQATNDGFIVLLSDGVRHKPARYVRQGDGWNRSWITGEHQNNTFGWVLGEDGETLVYDHSTASKPTQWYRARLTGARIESASQLTDLNPGFKDKPMPKSEIVHWIGALDDEVEGVLHYPLNYEEGKRYPLILMIHGGPTGVDMDGWTLNFIECMPLLNQKGAFVFRVNYHGSGNYPLEWVESISNGKYYELEIPDIESGVDYLIERGLVDPDKLATMGWSNGSILSTELVTRSPRYKALSAGAGDIEWISDWGNVDFGVAFDNYYFGASPLDDPDLYIRKSPFFRLENVTAPTLIFTGTEDRNVPPSQSWSHYRAMQQIGKTEVRFVTFPGEPHVLMQFVHQRRKVEEDLAWLDRHLFGTYEEPNESFKEGSPLDMALKRAHAQKVEADYGVQIQETLVPEVVLFKGLELGRFEVTRAQFAAFDREYRYAPGTGNHPANGVSLERAKAYCEWLTNRTGELYRLPSEEEVEAIYEAVRGSGNTLDYWAGYPANRDDAERLAEKIAELPGDAPLLREVGSFPGHGKEELVFDLGGSVSEWAIGKDGQGKLMGGSADRPSDPKAGSEMAAEAYRGFRVVRGEPKNGRQNPPL